MFPSFRSINSSVIDPSPFISNILNLVTLSKVSESSTPSHSAPLPSVKSSSSVLDSLAAVRLQRTNASSFSLSSKSLLNATLGLAVGVSAFFLFRSNSSLVLKGAGLILGALSFSACGARTGLRTDSSPDASVCRQDFGDNFVTLATPPSPTTFYRPMGIGGSQGQFVCYSEQTSSASPRNNYSLYFLDRNGAQAAQLLTNQYSDNASPRDCAISDDGRLVATLESAADANSQVVLFRAQGSGSSQTWTRETIGDSVFGLDIKVRISSDGREVFYSNSQAAALQVFNTQTRELRPLPIGDLYLFGSFSTSSDGNRIAFSAYEAGTGGSQSSRVYLHDRRDNSTIEVSQGLAAGSLQPFISGDGTRIYFRQNFSRSGVGDILHEWREGRGLLILSTQTNGSLPATGIMQINGISRQGDRILVATNARNFAPGVNIMERGLELFIWDAESNRRVLVSEDTCDQSILAGESLIDASGRYGIGSFSGNDDSIDQIHPLFGISFDQFLRP